MLEVLKFIFQDFWHWLGAFLMLTIICGSFAGLITIVKSK